MGHGSRPPTAQGAKGCCCGACRSLVQVCTKWAIGVSDPEMAHAHAYMQACAWAVAAPGLIWQHENELQSPPPHFECHIATPNLKTSTPPSPSILQLDPMPGTKMSAISDSLGHFRPSRVQNDRLIKADATVVRKGQSGNVCSSLKSIFRFWSVFWPSPTAVSKNGNGQVQCKPPGKLRHASRKHKCAI